MQNLIPNFKERNLTRGFKFGCNLQVQNEMIKPTIQGVLNIMKACLKAKTVRRLVFTSSAGTTNITEHQKPIIDETCWTDVEFCRRLNMTGWVSNFFLSINISFC